MSRSTELRKDSKALFYSGECNVCTTFVTKADRRLKPGSPIQFIPYQDFKNREELRSRGIPDDANFLAFRDEARNKTYTKSSAVMQVHYYSQFPYWGTYYGMLAIPKPVRDYAYDLFQKHKDKLPKGAFQDINSKFKPKPH